MATVVDGIPLSTWRDSWEMGPEGGGLEGPSGADCGHRPAGQMGWEVDRESD